MKYETDRPSDPEALIAGHFNGSLTEEQEQELTEQLKESAQVRRLFNSHMRLEGRLHSLGRDGFLRGPESGPDVTAKAIQPANEPHAGRFHLLRTSMPLIVSSAVLLAFCFWTLWPSRIDAAEVLREAQQAAAELVDRTYRLVDVRPDGDGVSVLRDLRITVRGGHRFVVHPENGAYVMGSDGADYWMARKNGPVCVTGDFRKLAPELQRQIPNRRLLNDVLASPDEPLLLGMSDLLLLIERRYDIELVDSPNAEEHHVRATRRSGGRGRPSMINFHADAETGVVLKAELNFADSRQRIFELIETPELSDHWYHHSEHAPDREVTRLEAAQ